MVLIHLHAAVVHNDAKFSSDPSKRTKITLLRAYISGLEVKFNKADSLSRVRSQQTD